MIHFATETPADIAAREALLDRVMGPARFLKPSEKLRAGRQPARGLALIARDADDVVGTVRLWNIAAGGKPALLLGPLCIDPSLQGRGVGAGLMQMRADHSDRAPDFARSACGVAPRLLPGRSYVEHRPAFRKLGMREAQLCPIETRLVERCRGKVL